MSTKTHDVCPVEHAGTFDRWYRYYLQNPDFILKGLVRPGMTALDIGAGPGYFTIPMAKMVGEKGKVIAADVQQGMLDLAAKKAAENGVKDRVELHLTEPGQIKVKEPVDFVLAFYMVHEVPDADSFMNEVFGILKPGGKLLAAEPAFFWLLQGMFKNLVDAALRAGFVALEQKRFFLARSVLLAKPEDAA
ncbi:hypothetical protein CAI21_12585 [Alkalilimnicola ehrlichii]|uniref:Methyltransferase domain-containing protein n=1 Tax=Alkalilimnicola ehrlichii TaxID=351052 RepID=A0A3E0X1D2_9GAMM|nr:class I SAM-dependent methyltransferase [Alkalilimnicola ehrlichii]RFA28400.1 hypothetical protein CAI21_12585 [Alkalilimnicola ehrlichii]RFA38536.1 hypothetical protein CAL65_04080 [Alkalilimnicola ehrlichii]